MCANTRLLSEKKNFLGIPKKLNNVVMENCNATFEHTEKKGKKSFPSANKICSERNFLSI